VHLRDLGEDRGNPSAAVDYTHTGMTRESGRATVTRCRTAALALVIASAAFAQGESRSAGGLGSVEKSMESLREATRRAKDPIERHRARERVRDEAIRIAATFTDAEIRSSEDSLIAGRILCEADRGREAVRHLVNGLRGLPGGMAPYSKLIDTKIPKGPDLTKKVSEADRKRMAAALMTAAENARQAGKTLQILMMFGLAFRNVDDEPTFVQLVKESKRIFGPSEPLGIPWEGAAVIPAGIMGVRGMPQAKLATLGRSYGELLSPDRRKTFEKTFGLLGRKAVLSDLKPLAATPGGPPALVDRVTVLHFVDAGGSPRPLELLKRLAASDPVVSIIGITHHSGKFVDPARGIPEKANLGESDESRLLLEQREAHGCSWPWFSAGPWKQVELGKQPAAPPRLMTQYEVDSPPTFVVVDRAATIRYFHPGEEDLSSLEEVVGLLVKEPRPGTRPAK
jgi:hypothetical protein